MPDMTLHPAFVKEIRDMLQQAWQKAYATVNFIMAETYWRIGRRIVEEEQQEKDRAEYGSFLIRELSKSLSAELGKGFALANLKNFRQFYLTFPDFEKSYALCSQLTFYRLIIRVPIKRQSKPKAPASAFRRVLKCTADPVRQYGRSAQLYPKGYSRVVI